MPKGNYIKGNDYAFLAQLKTFNGNIGTYSVILSVTAAQIAALLTDTVYLEYVLDSTALMQNGAQQWTTWKDLTRLGGTPPPTGAPMAPTLPVMVAAVVPGIETRFRGLVKQIKASPNYNPAIGEALGIEGAQQIAPDLTTVQPQIGVAINGNRVEVDWGWQGNSAYLDQCELQVDRGDGKGFLLLAYDTTPGYVDTMPFPAAPVKWTYKAIYRLNDAQVGQWSNPVTLTVGA
jgi:hypothetical protein